MIDVLAVAGRGLVYALGVAVVFQPPGWLSLAVGYGLALAVRDVRSAR